MQLQSFIAGRWQQGNGAPVALRDATTGQVIATACSDGLDIPASLVHAREVGGPNLRRLTFHERAALLKSLAKHLTEKKDELYALSYATGATKSDSWIDIDGGIATLFVYASKGMRELPDARVYVDGPTETLSKSGGFAGQHICVPLEGAAVHINAFNFPVWGMLEKLAPALLAGMPAIVKPATATAYLTELAFRRIDRVRHPAGGRRAAHLRRRRRPFRSSHVPGRGGLHRLGLDRAQAAHASQGDRPFRALHRRDRLAQLLRAWPRCRTGQRRSSTCSCARSRGR